MAKLVFSGPVRYRLRSLLALQRVTLQTVFRRLTGRPIMPDWDIGFEIGVRFWRHQFTAAMTALRLEDGRKIFDSLQTETDDLYDVLIQEISEPKGTWYLPRHRRGDTTVLHFHGGGYAFYGGISRRHVAMLAHRLGVPVFAPDYRLTPEHPHPAQAEDALTAWHHVLSRVPAEQIVVTGDSAGGHMALMLLQSLKAQAEAQPALCVGLCPWTDIADRGDSLHSNDRYDLVQGWMALKFGEWLDPGGVYGRAQLSPISHDFSGLAPIYIQLGGREVLRDMILEFVEVQKTMGAAIACDLWPAMPHNFHAYDSLKQSSTEALAKLADVVERRRLPGDTGD